MNSNNKQLWLTIVVASLGYFVDIYDLQLFNIVSKESLVGIGITDSNLIKNLDYSLFLWQMGGIILGGILWGILGDKQGRKKILFGSILLYSLANIANAFVTNIEMYMLVRFIAGIGLAGELGAAVTLISETMDKEKRGIGTMIIVTAGAMGAVAAVGISKLHITIFGLQNWQTAYIIGGCLGLTLLFLRFQTFESGLYDNLDISKNKKGNFLLIFSNRDRALRYLSCIAIGLPVWFCVGILIKFAPDFAKALNMHNSIHIDHTTCIVACYLGLSVGDLISGFLSQYFQSRKSIIFSYLFITILVCAYFLFIENHSEFVFYSLSFLIGASTGYWVLFVTNAAEQFGTNIRSTVASTVPNFVRGSTVPLVLSFKALESHFTIIQSATILGVITIGLAILAVRYLPDTFGKNLDFIEE